MKRYLMPPIIMAAALLLLLPGESKGQYYGFYDQSFLNYAIASQNAESLRKGIKTDSGFIGAANVNNGSRTAARGAVRGTTTFVSSGSPIIPKQLASYVSKSGSEQERIEGVFIKALNDYENFAKTVSYGTTGDLARADTILLLNCLFASRNVVATQEQKQGIYGAFKNFYETSSEFQSMSDRDKQGLYETKALFCAIIAVDNKVAEESHDAGRKQRVKDGAAFIVQTYLGVPIDKIQLTRNGVRIQ